MRTYTEQEVERIVHLRNLRYRLLSDQNPKSTNHKRLKNIKGELWQITKNPAYK
jgi:hypothetical protein